MPSVTQEWTHNLSFMQQSVLLGAIRGPDGQPKYNPPKMLLRWYRRCILISALDGMVLTDPVDPRGGSFTGPSVKIKGIPYEQVAARPIFWMESLDAHVAEYIKNLDGIPSHFSNHFRDAIQILGYKHPDVIIRDFWLRAYHRLVRDLHLYTEPEAEMDRRLGDNRSDWLETADPATQA